MPAANPQSPLSTVSSNPITPMLMIDRVLSVRTTLDLSGTAET